MPTTSTTTSGAGGISGVSSGTSGGSSGAAVGAELKGDAQNLKNSAMKRAESEAETRKDEASRAAKSTSSALRSAADDLANDDQAPEWLASGFRQAATKLADMADALQGKSVSEIGQQASRFARQSPGTFLAGSAAVGFALARVLRAGAEHESHATSGGGSTASTSYGAQGQLGQGSYGQGASGQGTSGQNTLGNSPLTQDPIARPATSYEPGGIGGTTNANWGKTQ